MRVVSAPVTGMRRLVIGSLAMALALAAAVLVTTDAQAHRNSCHRLRTCPSDHAKYLWRGLLCVSPDAAERTSAFRTVYVHKTYVYYCKR
jgi:hypothetical protein